MFLYPAFRAVKLNKCIVNGYKPKNTLAPFAIAALFSFSNCGAAHWATNRQLVEYYQ